MKYFFLIIAGLFLHSCGDEAELDSSAVKSTSSENSQNATGERQHSSQQIVVNSQQNQQLNNNNTDNLPSGPGFEDASRFGNVKKAMVKETAEDDNEENSPPPDLASGTLLEEYQYNKTSRSEGYDRCPNHARKNECQSKSTTFVKGTTIVGKNKCFCQ